MLFLQIELFEKKFLVIHIKYQISKENIFISKVKVKDMNKNIQLGFIQQKIEDYVIIISVQFKKRQRKL